MAAYKCKMCGANLTLAEGVTVTECEYCGSTQTVPAANDEKKMTQFTRANNLRFRCEFDKAAGIYESIVADFPDEPEAYWGLVLCKYGIEYVDDPATHRKIPTCHRTSVESVTEDTDYRKALENADPMAKSLYQEEAAQIEALCRSILEVSVKEEPYDIFICYKETDESGDRTLDSVLAQEVYDALVGKGYRVFFSRITLEDKLGTQYEPYIFAALNSAKVMLAFGTDPDYFNAVWVKNEWSRFLQLTAKGEKKVLIPCYKGMDPYDMPKEFARLQSQDLGKLGAVQDLLRGIEKIIPKETKVERVVVRETASPQSATVDSLLKRVFAFLADEEWKEATDYCNRVLDIDPENARAYLGLLMVTLQVRKQADLSNLSESFVNNPNYQKAIRYADSELAENLRGYIQNINCRIYDQAIEIMHRAAGKSNPKKDYESAISKFNEVQGFRDADAKTLECEQIIKDYVAKQAAKKAAKRALQKKISSLISAGGEHTVGLKSDGTVVTAGSNRFGRYKVSNWRDIVAVSAGSRHTVGLKLDGTVVAVGVNGNGQCKVSAWRDIVAVSAGYYHTVGLKSDGTVVAVGLNDFGECKVSAWRNIVAVSASLWHTVGLKSDGTVVAVGYNKYGECKVSAWRDIVAVSAGEEHTVGLKSDGTVVAVGENDFGQCDVFAWRDIVAVSAGGEHTVGLKSDGTAIAVGRNNFGQCEVSDWRDIVAISASRYCTVGLKSDGTVVVVGSNDCGQHNVSAWKLFGSIDTYEDEVSVAREKARVCASRRQSGLCPYCGGTFKGLIGKKCSSCGRPKDY